MESQFVAISEDVRAQNGKLQQGFQFGLHVTLP
jgi:hypothetical protein